jgi:hypothetical protein
MMQSADSNMAASDIHPDSKCAPEIGLKVSPRGSRPQKKANLNPLLVQPTSQSVSDTVKLLGSNDKVSVRELWQEDPLVDIERKHACKLGIEALLTDSLERLEQLKESQKRKRDEERLMHEQKKHEKREEEEKRAEIRRRRIEQAETKKAERVRLQEELKKRAELRQQNEVS